MLESQHRREKLVASGVLNIKWPVRIYAVRPEDQVNIEGEYKVLHLVRHGQGFHNLLADIARSGGQQFDSSGKFKGDPSEHPYIRPEILDPPLTALGREQALAQQAAARAVNVELVVVSPLSRATHTGLLAFQHLVPKTRPSDESVASGPPVAFVCQPLCAEQQGVHICDKHRPIGELEVDFPFVDYSVALEHEGFPWEEGRRESDVEVATRGFAFMLWLRALEEREIAVATHSAWLFTLLNAVIDTANTPELSYWFQTGELRTVVVRFEDCEENTATQSDLTGPQVE